MTKVLSAALLLTATLFANSLFAQKTTVLAEKDEAPISHVLIYNEGSKTQVTTNAEGEANLSGFAMNDMLTIQHASYKTVRITKTKLSKKGYKLYLTMSVVVIPEFSFVVARDVVVEEESHMKMERLESKDIALRNPQTTADMLEMSGSVMVQKSQMGGGSPIIRGFEANKVLMVVDGVRMNNAIYRSGHLQNAITIDNNVLERTEVLFGPGSVIYGSDALGGGDSLSYKDTFRCERLNDH